MSEHLLAAYVLILLKKDNAILLLKRSATSSFAPNHYSLPGGRIEKNETFRQALVREVQEELGITINESQLTFTHSFYRKGTENELVAFIFECRQWQGDIINREPAKHSQLEWFDINNLPSPLIPAHQSALSLIKEKQLYSEQS